MEEKLLFHTEYRQKYPSVISQLNALIFPIILTTFGFVILVFTILDWNDNQNYLGLLFFGCLLLMAYIIWPFPKYTIDLNEEFFDFKISPNRVSSSNGSFTYHDIRKCKFKSTNHSFSIELKDGTRYSMNLYGMEEDEKGKFFETLKSKQIGIDFN